MTDRIYGIDRAEGLSQVFGYLPSGKRVTQSSQPDTCCLIWVSDYFLDRKEWTPEEKDPESMFSFYLDVSFWLLICLLKIIADEDYNGSTIITSPHDVAL